MAEFDEDKHPRDMAGKFTAGGDNAHDATAAEHRQEASAARAAAEKESDPRVRSEHLAQASHHDSEAFRASVRADAQREVEKAAERIARENRAPVAAGLAQRAAPPAEPAVAAPRPPANDGHHDSAREQKMEALAKLVSGSKKLSDKAVLQKLGVSRAEAHGLMQGLREKHGVAMNESLRDKLRSAAKGSKDAGSKEHGSKEEHGEKEEGHGGGEHGGLAEWLKEKAEGLSEKVEQVGDRVNRAQEAALRGEYLKAADAAALGGGQG